MQISKSDFQKFRHCPEAFWIRKFANELLQSKPLSAFEQQIIDQGHEVELWARRLFPEGVLVESFGEDAVNLTKELIQANHKVIYQATFSADNLFSMCDMIVWNGSLSAWDIYEVKGSTSKDKSKREYYWDIAFQRETLERAGAPVGSLYLVELNKEFIKHGEINPQELLVATDITSEVNTMRIEIQSEIGSAKAKLNQTSQPSGCACKYKTRKHQCEAFGHFYPNVPEYAVYDLSRIRSGGKKIVEMVDGGILAIDNVPEDIKLSPIQTNQVHVHNFDTIIHKEQELMDHLKALVYPIYFLDYETYPAAVPVFDNCKPFQQVPFQYSLHVQESQGSELVHFEYLHIEHSNPIPELAAQLRKHIGDQGSVVVWNATFEGGCNKDMALQVPSLSKFLLGLNERFYDLEVPFKKQMYVTKEFKGKTSIKYALPALVPELSYSDLNIQNGGAACASWKQMIFDDRRQDEKDQIFTDLLAYCKLDTLAMVRILRFLKQL